MGATASLRGANKGAAFAVAKSALRIFSQSLAKEYAAFGVHIVHFVVDGMINNPRTRALNPQLPEQRFMAPESLAQPILHIFKNRVVFPSNGTPGYPSVWQKETSAKNST